MEEIQEEVECYFKNILTPRPSGDTLNLKWQPNTTLNEDQKTLLEEEVTNEEIEKVIGMSKEGKAFGPNDFTLSFFKAGWEVVGMDVIVATKHYFSTGRFLKEVNYTFISLIPKKLEAASFNDYRPISLFNLIYKFITQIIANCLKRVMNVLVRSNQTIFIEGHSIVENILLYHEVV